MITAKEATAAALNYFTDVVNAPVDNLALEEIEADESGQTWLVTLGFSYHVNNPFITGAEASRHYKLLTVDGTTSAIKSMKIRKIG